MSLYLTDKQLQEQKRIFNHIAEKLKDMIIDTKNMLKDTEAGTPFLYVAGRASGLEDTYNLFRGYADQVQQQEGLGMETKLLVWANNAKSCSEALHSLSQSATPNLQEVVQILELLEDSLNSIVWTVEHMDK